MIAIREIRKEIKFTQKKMAELLGVKAITVQKIEYGTRRLIPAIARRYQAETGCDLVNGAVVATINGLPYTRADFDRHQNAKAALEDGEKIQKILSEIETDLKAAQSSGQFFVALARLEVVRVRWMQGLSSKD